MTINAENPRMILLLSFQVLKHVLSNVLTLWNFV